MTDLETKINVNFFLKSQINNGLFLNIQSCPDSLQLVLKSMKNIGDLDSLKTIYP